jgi:hypothetical protein
MRNGAIMIKVISESFSNKKVTYRTFNTTFSEKAVLNMAMDAKGKNIYYNYNTMEKVGVVTSVSLDNGMVSVVAEIDGKYIVGYDQFICPAFIVDCDNWGESEKDRVITKANVTHFGLIENPIETCLKPMERI